MLDLIPKRLEIIGLLELIELLTEMLLEEIHKIIYSGNPNGLIHILLITTSDYIFDHSKSILLEGI